TRLRGRWRAGGRSRMNIVDDLRISMPRLRGRLDALAEIGAIDGGGCARLALIDEDRLGRDLVMMWMHDLGLRVDIDEIGNVVGEELVRIGYAGREPCPARAPRAYVELHIEQGPVLEAQGVTIGAVTGVQGISWTEVSVVGQSNHAGTTPMHLRHDAGFVAGEIVGFARRLAADLGPPQVAT